uniref:Uncharacterized protein n=1 Tax=Anguilla anguilla TaxID=7936 RepID=A0A0E9QHY3_ANGAN
MAGAPSLRCTAKYVRPKGPFSQIGSTQHYNNNKKSTHKNQHTKKVTVRELLLLTDTNQT